MEQCACVLREGGILVVDGVHLPGSKDRVTAILGKYLQTNPSLGLVPFLDAKNKLYVCNKQWKTDYTKYLLEHADILQRLQIRGTTNALYGVQYTYLTIG
jgi:hypothetical protein